MVSGDDSATGLARLVACFGTLHLPRLTTLLLILCKLAVINCGDDTTRQRTCFVPETHAPETRVA
jgi:hypothetical protein